MLDEYEVLRGNQMLVIFPNEISQDLEFLCWIKHAMKSSRKIDFIPVCN